MTLTPPSPDTPELPDLVRSLTAAETRVWQALVEGDAEADEAALDPGFLGVYPSGFAGRDDHVAQLAGGPTVERFALDRLRALPLGTDHAVLSYRARFRRVGAADDEEMYVSSIWRRAGAGWINIFSQDTPVPQP